MNSPRRRAYLLDVVRALERLPEHPTAWATLRATAHGREWEVGIDNFEVYMHSPAFRDIARGAHRRARDEGWFIVFCCVQRPTAEMLWEAEAAGRLIIDC